MIDVTGINKVAFAKAVYRLSVPKGMGFLPATMGELDDVIAQEIADCETFHMDYVNGRGCKMWLREDNKKLLAPDSWYDHTNDDYKQLLSEFGFNLEKDPEHGCCCECDKCKPEKINRSPVWEKMNAIPSN